MLLSLLQTVVRLVVLTTTLGAKLPIGAILKLEGTPWSPVGRTLVYRTLLCRGRPSIMALVNAFPTGDSIGIPPTWYRGRFMCSIPLLVLIRAGMLLLVLARGMCRGLRGQHLLTGCPPAPLPRKGSIALCKNSRTSLCSLPTGTGEYGLIVV